MVKERPERGVLFLLILGSVCERTEVFLPREFEVNDPVGYSDLAEADRFVDVIRGAARRLKVVAEAGYAVDPERAVREQAEPLFGVSFSALGSVHDDAHVVSAFGFFVVVDVADESAVGYALKIGVETLWLAADPPRDQIVPFGLRVRDAPVGREPRRVVRHSGGIGHHFDIKRAVLRTGDIKAKGWGHGDLRWDDFVGINIANMIRFFKGGEFKSLQPKGKHACSVL